MKRLPGLVPLGWVFWVGVTLAACEGCTSPAPSSPNPSAATSIPEKVVAVEAVRPERRDLPYFLTAVGSLEAKEEVEIRSEVNGTVERVLVEEGSAVRPGELMVQVDPEEYRLQVAEREARLAEARVNLENARTTFARQARLFQQGVVSEQLRDDAQLKVEVYRVAVENAQASLDRARKSLRDTEIRAPIAGIISRRIVSPGEYVGPSDREALLRLVEIHPLKLSFTLPEMHASRVRPGQRVEFRVKAYPTESFAGQVYFVNPQANPQTRSLELKAWVPNPEGRLKPGFFAEVQLLQGVHRGALILPEEAITPQQDRMLVYRVEGVRARPREVRLGMRFEGKVEILAGIGPEDQVITVASAALADGSLVRVEGRKTVN